MTESFLNARTASSEANRRSLLCGKRLVMAPRAFALMTLLLVGVLCGRVQAADTTAPVVTIVTPADTSHITSLSDIKVTVTDETGVAGFERFSLSRYVGGTLLFWNGTAWTSSLFKLATVMDPATQWTVTTALPSGSDLPHGSYRVDVIAKDVAGNQNAPKTSYFAVGNDRTAPSSTINTPANGSHVTSLPLISTTTDNIVSPPLVPGGSPGDTENIRYLSTALRKRVGTTSTYLCWDFVNHVWTASSWGLMYYPTGPTDSTWSVNTNMPTGADLPLGEYFVNQYCMDYGNNQSNTYSYFTVVAPPAPTVLTAAPRGLAADLAWAAPAYPSGTTGSITSYRVERQVGSGAWGTLATTTARTYADNGLENGVAYTYRVVALDGVNASVPSATATVTPVTDEAIPVVTIDTPATTPAVGSRITSLTGISGTATDAAGGTGVASFVQLYLRRYSGSQTLFWTGTAWITHPTSVAGTFAATGVTSTTWQVSTALPSGTNLPPGWYQAEARIKDVAGNLSDTKVNNFIVGSDETPPSITFDAPGNGATATRLPELTLTTANTASPGEQDTTGLWRSRVFLWRFAAPNGLPATQAWDFNTQAWITGSTPVYYDYPTDTADQTVSLTSNIPAGANLARGIYTLTADVNDYSHNSVAGTWTFTIVAPPAPTVLTATPAAGAVNLAWTAPVYPAGTTGSITSYRIERKTGEGAWSTLGTATGTSYSDTTVSGGTSYSYRVYARDGVNESAASNTATASAAALTVSLASTVVEGGTLTGTVTRNTPTADALTVSLSSGNTAAATVPATMTIAAGATEGTFTLTAVDDATLRATQNVTITAAATGHFSGTDTVAVTDNDVAGVTFTPVTGLTTTEAPGTGHTATFTVALTSQPTAEVTIALSSSDSGEGTVEPATLTFTSGNWNETQLVTVTGVPDGLVDGDQPYTIVTAATSTDTFYDGLAVDDVAVTSIDEDTAKLTVALAATVAEGGTLTGTVTRNTPTTAALEVTLASDDTAQATVPATVTIAAGQASRTFTFSPVDDAVVDGAHDVTVTATATGFTAATDTVSVTDVSSGAVDALIRKQGDPAFTGNGVVNTTATGQTAAQNAAGNVLKSYDVRVFNRQTAAHALTLKASASAGGGTWTITYFDGASDITAAITSAEGWTTAATIDPAASTTIRIDVKPAITVEADTVKTVTLTATMAGDAEASDTVKASTTKTGAAPPVLTAAAGDSQILLEWTPVVGATAYTLSRGPASFGPWTALPDTAATTYLDDAVTNGTTYYYQVTATVAAVEGDASNVVSATPHVVTRLDLSIRLKQPEGEEETYLGTNVYNLTGAGQTRTKVTYAGNKLVFQVKLANDSGQTETYSLKASDATDGWAVKFYDGWQESPEKEITAQVKATIGWGVLIVNGVANARDVLVTMTPATTGTVAPLKEVLLTATPRAGDSTADNSDAVKAAAGLQGIGRIDWSPDGETWSHATGANAVPVPLTLFDSTVSFRAIKSNPDFDWPDVTGALPSWQNGDTVVTGETVSLGFHTVPTATISASCGNTLSVVVPVRPDLDVSLSGSTEVMATDSNLASTREATLTAKVVNRQNIPSAGTKIRFQAKYEDGTTAGELGAAGTADDTVTTGVDGKAVINWKGTTRVGIVTFTAEVIDVNNDTTGQKDTWLILLRKSDVVVNTGGWSQDNAGAWSRSVTATAYLNTLKIPGRQITLAPEVLLNGELVTGNIAPLDNATGTTTSTGEFTTVQRWNPSYVGDWPDDYTVDVYTTSTD